MCKTIMISGPHAIGKTTTAKNLNKLHPEYLYVQSFAGPIAKEMGYDLNANPTPKETLAYQQRVLQAFQMSYDITAKEYTLYDRSPLDFAVYTILQLRDCIELQDELFKYVQQCLLTTMGYCDYLVLPEADLDAEYEDKGNRPKFSPEQIQYRKDYAELLDYYSGKVSGITKVIRVPAGYQYEDRVKFIEDQLEEAFV